MKINHQEAGRLGAIKRYIIYGNPGTTDGRIKGGFASIAKFRSNPELSLRKGFKLEKKITVPQRSPLLSEFIGIVLGDGSLSNYQVKIYFNAKTDNYYANFVKNMVIKLFNINAKVALRPKNTLELMISSRGLVKFLLALGLKNGDKIKQQATVPNWILKDDEYSFACLRGLMDTDGGIYFHNHTTKGIRYRNIALCFTSRSIPLLCSVENIFLALGIKAMNNMRERVFVYNKSGIDKYMRIIGTHNSNFLNRFDSYKGTKL